MKFGCSPTGGAGGGGQLSGAIASDCANRNCEAESCAPWVAVPAVGFTV